MFQFRRFPPIDYVFIYRFHILSMEGFPIRKSADITAICASPQLIAACHVLRRLPMPRHSPCALISLNSFFISFLIWCMSFANRLFLLVVINYPILFSWKDLKFSVNNNLISFCLDLLSPIHFSMSALGIYEYPPKDTSLEISFR